MAVEPKLITIDPNGDTLIILSNPKAELQELSLPEELDALEYEAADSETSYESDATERATHDSTANKSDVVVEEAPAVRFLVSSRQLRIVSTYFDNMFKCSCSESVPNLDDGLYHIAAYGWSSKAMEVVLDIAHVQAKRIPGVVPLEFFVMILSIVDYYQMQDTIAIYVKLWMLQIQALSKPVVYCTEAVCWLFLAFQLKEHDLFEKIANVIVTTAPSHIQTLDLPFPPVVQEKLNYLRSSGIMKLYSSIQLLEHKLYAGKAGCSNACNAMLLGSLLQGLHNVNLLSFTESYGVGSFTNARLNVLWAKLGIIETPVWYETPQSEPHDGCELQRRLHTICLLSRIQTRVVLSEFGL